ncbi:ABC transporter permease, partial [Listeria monocytogenes]|nr:ABC transporter permease [Listeria monocytogenes]
MNFFKRAWLSMKARKGRSVLQLIIFTVVCVLILSGFTIQSAADKASELAREQLGGTVTLTVDQEKQMAAMQKEASSSDETSTDTKPKFQSNPIDVSDANDLAALEHVKSYNYYSSTQALASGFDPIESSGDTSTSDDSTSSKDTEGPGGGNGGPQMVDADLSINGLLDSETSTDFEAGTSELTSGVAITADDKGKNVAMVEENLAKQNDWKVGDSFTVTSSDGNTKVTLKIVGIYKTTDSGSDMAQNFS